MPSSLIKFSPDEVAVRLSAAVFGVAPSNALLNSYKAEVVRVGESVFARNLAESVAKMSSADLTAALLNNLGVSAATIGTAGFAALSPALTTLFDAYGVAARGQIILNVTRLLADLESDATYGAAAKTWNGRTDASFTYASSASNTTTTSISVLGNQTPSDAGFQLTSSTDVATATKFVSVPTYTPAGNAFVNSLQDVDRLTGTAATDDTLTATLGNANDNGGATITPQLRDIESVFFRFVGSGTAAAASPAVNNINLQDSTGVKSASITNVSSDAAAVTGLAAETTMLSVANTNVPAALTFGYRSVAIEGTADVANVSVSNIEATTLTIGRTQGSNTQQVETVNLTAAAGSGVARITTLDLGVDTVAATSQALNIDAKSNISIAGFAALGPAGLASIGVTGAGNVTLGGVGSFISGGRVSFSLAGASHTGNLTADITAAAGGVPSSVTSGSGNDVITTTASLVADVTTNAGDDSLTVAGAAPTTAPEAAAVVTAGGVAVAADSSVSTGAGNDTLTVGTVTAASLAPNGVSIRTGQLAGTVAGGTTVDMGEGNDTVIIGNAGGVSLGEEAVLTLGAGNDTVALTGSIAGDTADANTDGDTLAGQINAGDGDDTVTFNLNGLGDRGTLISGNVDGGAGANTIVVTGNADANVVEFAGTAADRANADRVTAVQTLNLVSTQSVSAAMATTINGVRASTVAQNDDDAETGDYSVEASEFTGLTAISATNQAGIIDATGPESATPRRFIGDAITVRVNELQGGEAITVSTVETGAAIAGQTRVSGTVDGRVRGSTELADDAGADLTLELSLAKAAAAATATVTVAAVGITGQTDGDVTIVDTRNSAVAEAATDVTRNIDNLNLAVNGSSNRTVNLGAGDFRTNLTLTSDAAAGTTLTVREVEATVIAAGTVNANLNIFALTSEGKTITTGAGNDTVNLTADVVNSANTVAAASRDTIDLGAGANRLVVSNSMRGTGADADEVFDNIRNVQTLQLSNVTAGSTVNVTLDDDAFATGITTVIVDPTLQSNIALGADFNRAIAIQAGRGSNVSINNTDVNATVQVAAQAAVGAAAADTFLTFADPGITAANVAVEVTVDAVAQVIAGTDSAASNDVVVSNLLTSGEIDSITLKDSVQTSTVGAGGVNSAAQTATGTITLTLGSNWAQASDVLTVDASDLNDDDLDANADGDRVDAATGADVAGFAGDTANDINDTQTVSIDASGVTYRVNIKGAQLVDTIVGSNRADTIDGQAGADIITGGEGADALTGGAGADTFVYTAVTQSNNDTLDSITDFTTGSDKVRISVTAVANEVVNLGRFAVVANSGDGNRSLSGSATGAKVVGDAYYDQALGRLSVDVDGNGDVTAAADYTIQVGSLVASDVNFVVTGTDPVGGVGGNDTIRGGQGADTLSGGAGNDVFVLVGSLTAADVDAYAAAGAAANINADVAKVLTQAELITQRTASEVNAGDSINGGDGTADTLHVYGTANLTNVTLANVETLTVHSNVTVTLAQLNAFTNIVFSGPASHTLSVVTAAGATGTAVTPADIAAALGGKNVTVENAAGNTTIALGNGAAVGVGTFVTTTVPNASAGANVNVTADTSVENITGLLNDAGVGTVKVNVSNMSKAQLEAVATGIAKVATDGITGSLSLSVAPTQATVDALVGNNKAAAGLSVVGTIGADTINLAAASKAVTVTASSGNDTITSGAGADMIDLGSGNDTVILTAANTRAVTLGDPTTYTSVDVITGFGSGDTLSLPFTPTSIVSTSTAGSAAGTVVASIAGTYAGSAFTPAANGVDRLFVFDADGSGVNTATNAVVLVGFGTTGSTGSSAFGG